MAAKYFDDFSTIFDLKFSVCGHVLAIGTMIQRSSWHFRPKLGVGKKGFLLVWKEAKLCQAFGGLWHFGGTSSLRL